MIFSKKFKREFWQEKKFFKGEQRPKLNPLMPLDLEIGCGNGRHPIAYAQRNKARQILAIEHTHTRFTAFEKKLQLLGRQRPQNLFAIHANAISWVYEFLGEASLDRVFLLYPNPYPKASQLNKRWYAMCFMGYLHKTLKAGGTLELSSNLEFYLEEAKHYMPGLWGFKLIEEKTLSLKQCAAENFAARTQFEEKYLKAQMTCKSLIFQKL